MYQKPRNMRSISPSIYLIAPKTSAILQTKSTRLHRHVCNRYFHLGKFGSYQREPGITDASGMMM